MASLKVDSCLLSWLRAAPFSTRIGIKSFEVGWLQPSLPPRVVGLDAAQETLWSLGGFAQSRRMQREAGVCGGAGEVSRRLCNLLTRALGLLHQPTPWQVMGLEFQGMSRQYLSNASFVTQHLPCLLGQLQDTSRQAKLHVTL